MEIHRIIGTYVLVFYKNRFFEGPNSYVMLELPSTSTINEKKFKYLFLRVTIIAGLRQNFQFATAQ